MQTDKQISSEGTLEGKGVEERQEWVCLSFTDLGESLESPQRCDALASSVLGPPMGPIAVDVLQHPVHCLPRHLATFLRGA